MRMSNQPIQLLIVDDQAMARKALKALLNEYEDLIVVGEAANGLSAVELVSKLKPDIVLMDLSMPGLLNADGSIANTVQAFPAKVGLQSNVRQMLPQ